MRYIVIAAAMGLCSFVLPSIAATTSSNDRLIGPARLPFDTSVGFLDGYSLPVPRNGEFFWNGAPIGQAVLKTYLRQWVALPKGEGRLFVAFEPGTRRSA